MNYSPLTCAILKKRYKRFLADVVLENGETVTAHCANTGAMTGLAEPGARIWLSHSDNPKRKLAWSWELTEVDVGAGQAMASVNTARANALVREALEAAHIEPLSHYTTIRPEVRVGTERLDFLLTHPGCPDAYVEVKQVTLLGEGGQGYFPDAVSTRGLRHLEALIALSHAGHCAILLFCVPHTAIRSVSAACHIDAAYAEGLNRARQAGVEIMAYGVDIATTGMTLAAPLPVL